MRCRENATLYLMLPTFCSHAEWCDFMWGSGHTYCFRPYRGYHSQSYSTEMVEVTNAFYGGWEGETGNSTSQLNSIAEIGWERIFSGVSRSSQDIWRPKLDRLGISCLGPPLFTPLHLRDCLHPALGCCTWWVKCLHSVWLPYKDNNITQSLGKSTKVCLLTQSTNMTTENHSPLKGATQAEMSGTAVCQRQCFPVIFMSLHKKEIRNWSLHSLPFINVCNVYVVL